MQRCSILPILLLLFACSSSAVTFTPTSGGISCLGSGSGGLFTGGTFVVLSGGCTEGFAGGAAGTGTGTIGNLFVGFSFSVTGPIQFGNILFMVNGQPFAFNVTGGAQTFDLSGGLSGQVLSQWSVSAQVQAAGATIVAPQVYLSEVPFGDGSSQSSPLPPTGGSAGSWIFNNISSGRHIDPPLATGFEYTGTGGTLFSKITLPTGFASPFTILYGPGFGTATGPINSGSQVDFVALGGAVGAFRITGINPVVDAGNPNAFPLQVFFTESTGSLTQIAIEPVPEPSTFILAGAALAAILKRQRLAFSRSASQ